uniref:Gamma-glutamylcyclotransferase n=1 Tax=Cyprinus carpio TaxID=7962 RepID=A0A8C1SZI5_CYPCA
MSSSGCFMYFAYGSNLLKERLQLKNPSAVIKVKKHMLSFKGSASSERVDEGVYSPLEVKVETKEGPLLCRTYKMNNFRPCLPSLQYKKVQFAVHYYNALQY